ESWRRPSGLSLHHRRGWQQLDSQSTEVYGLPQPRRPHLVTPDRSRSGPGAADPPHPDQQRYSGRTRCPAPARTGGLASRDTASFLSLCVVCLMGAWCAYSPAKSLGWTLIVLNRRVASTSAGTAEGVDQALWRLDAARGVTWPRSLGCDHLATVT